MPHQHVDFYQPVAPSAFVVTQDKIDNFVKILERENKSLAAIRPTCHRSKRSFWGTSLSITWFSAKNLTGYHREEVRLAQRMLGRQLIRDNSLEGEERSLRAEFEKLRKQNGFKSPSIINYVTDSKSMYDDQIALRQRFGMSASESIIRLGRISFDPKTQVCQFGSIKAKLIDPHL